MEQGKHAAPAALIFPKNEITGMVWTQCNRGGGKNPWFRGQWIVELGDRFKIKNPMFASRAVWYTKGVIEIYINTYYGFRMSPTESAKRIGRALQQLFGTKGRFICDITKGHCYKDYVQQTVMWYAKSPEKPDIAKVEEVLAAVAENAVEEEYEATVKATGSTEYYLDSELHTVKESDPVAANRIRKYAYEPELAGKVIYGRIWKVKTLS